MPGFMDIHFPCDSLGCGMWVVIASSTTDATRKEIRQILRRFAPREASGMLHLPGAGGVGASRAMGGFAGEVDAIAQLP